MKSLYVISCAFLYCLYVVRAEVVSYSCRTNYVLAVSSQNDTEIDMNQVQAKICDEVRPCIYTDGKCTKKGSYLAGISNENGKYTQSCCEYSPPVPKHAEDQCESIVIETDGGGSPMTHPKGPSPPVPHPPAGGGGGAGNNEKVVAMQVKETKPASDQRLVKSIEPLHAGSNGAKGYVVTTCRPVCQRSTTTKRPTTRQPTTQPPKHQEEQAEHPKKKLFGEGGPKCFSADMLVTTPYGAKRMDEVRAGDEVLVSTADSKPIFEPIEWLYHKNPDVEADFLTVTTGTGRTIQMSANHMIPIMQCSDDTSIEAVGGAGYLAETQSRFARRLKIGDCIASLSLSEGGSELIADKVVRVSQERKRGIYSPITKQGTIVVNDVFASCFSSFENQLIQKTVHSVIIDIRRVMAKIWQTMFGGAATTLSPEDANIPLPLQMLLKMAQFVLPSTVFNVY